MTSRCFTFGIRVSNVSLAPSTVPESRKFKTYSQRESPTVSQVFQKKMLAPYIFQGICIATYKKLLSLSHFLTLGIRCESGLGSLHSHRSL